jgi:hypothetical protein
MNRLNPTTRPTLLNRIALIAAGLGLVALTGCDDGFGGYGAGPIDHDTFIEYIRS